MGNDDVEYCMYRWVLESPRIETIIVGYRKGSDAGVIHRTQPRLIVITHTPSATVIADETGFVVAPVDRDGILNSWNRRSYDRVIRRS